MEQRGPVAYDRLVELFGLLHSVTVKFLEDNSYTTQSLLVCITDMTPVRCCLKSSALKDLEHASSVSDVFHILKKSNLLSPLHYEVIKHVIIKLCSECKDLQNGLVGYESSHKEYIEVPLHKSCQAGRFEMLNEADSEDKTDLVITAEDGNTSFADILDLENVLAKAFRYSQVVLHIRYIELQPPHLTLVYGIPCSMVDFIFPLTLEEWDELRSRGISEIHCTECHYMLDDKGNSHVSQCTLVLKMLFHMQHPLVQS